MSVAHRNRRQLESLGDCVTRANVDWFAIFPDKLAELDPVAAGNGRAPHLVVYRTRSGDDRDHHVIPLSDLALLLRDSTPTHSEVNGTVRWNVTLKDHTVRVSHTDISVNVERYHRAPLAIEVGGSNDPTQATDLEPPTRVLATTYRVLRDTAVARQLKEAHGYRCQVCGMTIEPPGGLRYAEAHHIRPLGRPHEGSDVRENILILCPNHHAMCDYGVIRLAPGELRRVDGHTPGLDFIAYHNDRLYRGAVAPE